MNGVRPRWLLLMGALLGSWGCDSSGGGSYAHTEIEALPGEPDSLRAQEVCARWRQDRETPDEGSWSGSEETCDSGEVTASARTGALKLINLYRFLAGLNDDIADDPERNRSAQRCALMMLANQALSHRPPESWRCFSEEGAVAAANSNISSEPAVLAVDRYMIDITHTDTLGHRRWLLAADLGPVGVGSTVEGPSCLWVTDGNGTAKRPWVAWPPPGPVPYAAFRTTGRLEESGWSIQSDTIDFEGGTVTVHLDGRELSVDVFDLPARYGSKSALRFVPKGWRVWAGDTYEVTVTGSETVSYAVEIVSCE